MKRSYADWFATLAVANGFFRDGPFDTATLREASLAAVAEGVDGAVRVLDDEAKNPLRRLAEGAWPL